VNGRTEQRILLNRQTKMSHGSERTGENSDTSETLAAIEGSHDTSPPPRRAHAGAHNPEAGEGSEAAGEDSEASAPRRARLAAHDPDENRFSPRPLEPRRARPVWHRRAMACWLKLRPSQALRFFALAPNPALRKASSTRPL